jgi:NAD(P)-dependent dehydrogenase (short-subunit alcohol dehydrogenase family)
MAQTILITGANRGVGLALAQAAAARGDTVLAGAREPNGCDGFVKLQAEGHAVETFRLDVTQPEAMTDVAGFLADRPLDLLVCNAGQLIGRGGLDDPAYTPEAWAQVLMANVAGPFFTARAFLPMLLRAKAPKIAVISPIMGSTAGASGNAYLYRASKAAATNLAANLAAELKPQGVAVGAYHPGWVRTDMGGQGAAISPEESADGLLARFDALSIKTTGAFEDWRGEPIAF